MQSAETSHICIAVSSTKLKCTAIRKIRDIKFLKRTDVNSKLSNLLV